jgi:hypothetical protein
MRSKTFLDLVREKLERSDPVSRALSAAGIAGPDHLAGFNPVYGAFSALGPRAFDTRQPSSRTPS